MTLSGVPEVGRTRTLAILYMVMACSLAAVLALLFLGAKSFWQDEAESVAFADPQRSLKLVASTDGGNFALYYALLHLWLHFGSSDAYVRVLSVISAVLAVGCLFILGSRLFGARVGTVAAFLLAANPFFIAYAQEARGYSLLLLATIVSMLYFVQCLVKPASVWNVVAYVLASVLMVYTHVIGVLVLAAQLVALLLIRPPVAWRTIALASVSVATLLVPLALAADRHGVQGLAWIPPISVGTVGVFFETIAGSLPLLCLDLALATYFIVDSLRNSIQSPHVKVQPHLLLLAWFLAPLALTVVFSLFAFPIFVPRYLIIVLPPFLLFISYALESLRHPVMRATAFGVYVVLSAQGLWHYYLFEPKEDWRGAAAFVTSVAQPSDYVVCSPPWARVPFQHALERLPAHRNVPAMIPAPLLSAHRPGGSLAQRLFLSDLRGRSRVWLVAEEVGKQAPNFASAMNEQGVIIESELVRGRRLLLRHSFTDIDVRLYTQAQPSKP